MIRLDFYCQNRLTIGLTFCILSACVSVSETPKEIVPSNTSQGSRKTLVKVGHSREPTLQEREVIKQLMDETEQVRKLKFVRPVPVLIQDRSAITSHIEEQIEDEDLEKAQIVYTALGLLDPDLDVKKLLLRVLGEQVLGYYNPKARQLVVRDDIMRDFQTGHNETSSDFIDEARIALVHELVHALQNQHLSLHKNIETERDIDAENAFRALIEGDATLAMLGYILRRKQPNLRLSHLTKNPVWIRSLASMVEQIPMAGPELAEAPPIVRIPLLSAYIDGLAFAAELHGHGGWTALDTAHKNPPVSTEQVLHPKHFFRGEVPSPARLPATNALIKAGYVLVEEDTLGELELSIYFGQSLAEDAAAKAAEGWGWDKLRVYRSSRGETPVIWFTTWDNENEAEQAEQAALQVQNSVTENRRKRYFVERRGRTVLIVRELPEYLHQELLDTWKSWGEILDYTHQNGITSNPEASVRRWSHVETIAKRSPFIDLFHRFSSSVTIIQSSQTLPMQMVVQTPQLSPFSTNPKHLHLCIHELTCLTVCNSHISTAQPA